VSPEDLFENHDGRSHVASVSNGIRGSARLPLPLPVKLTEVAQGPIGYKTIRAPMEFGVS
jgi:hypothetical protein